MNCILVILALLHLALSAPPQTQTTVQTTTSEGSALKSLLSDLVNQLPLTKIHEISLNHFKSDQGYQAALKYFQSPEWSEIIENVRKVPDWQAFKEKLRDTGLDIEPMFVQMTHCINSTNTSDLSVDVKTADLAQYIEEVKMEMMVPAMKALGEFGRKMGTENMKKVGEQLGSEENKDLLLRALQSDAMKRMLKKLGELGVNVNEALWLAFSVFGWPPVKLE